VSFFRKAYSCNALRQREYYDLRPEVEYLAKLAILASPSFTDIRNAPGIRYLKIHPPST
jgi:hypothetical protein